MNKDSIDLTSGASRLRQILFSLNIGLALALLLRAYLSRFASGRNVLSDFTTRIVGRINGLFHLLPRDYNPAGVELTFLGWTIALASTILLMLRLVRGTAASPLILNRVAGLTALLAVPASLLYAHMILWPAPVVGDNEVWLILEVGAALVCLILYFSGKWRVGAWYTVVLILLHYSLWAWVGWRLYSHAVFPLGVTLVPSASGLAWILYVRGHGRPGVRA